MASKQCTGVLYVKHTRVEGHLVDLHFEFLPRYRFEATFVIFPMASKFLKLIKMITREPPF